MSPSRPPVISSGVGDLVDGDHCLDLGRACVQVGANRRDGNIDDERVRHRDELRG